MSSPIDITQVLNAARVAQDVAAKAAENVQTLSDNSERLRDASAVAQQEELRKKQESDKRLLGLQRLDPNAADNLIVSLITEKNSLEAERKALFQDFKRKQAIAFTDDPLGWVQAQFTIDSIAEQHNTVVDRIDSIDATVKDAPAFASASLTAYNAGRVAHDVRSQANEALALEVAAADKKLAAAREAANFGMTLAASTLQFSNAAMDASYKKFQAEQSAASLALQKQDHELRRRQVELAMSEKSFYDKVGAAAAPLFGGQSLPGIMVERIMSSQADSPDKALLMSVAMGKSLGDTTGEAIVILGSTNTTFKNPQQQAAAQQYRKLEEDFLKENSSKYDLAAWKKLGFREKSTAIDDWLKTKLYDPMKKGTYVVDNDSIYAAPAIGEFKAMYGPNGMADNRLWSQQLSQRADNIQITPDLVFSTARSMISSGAYGPLDGGAIERAAADIRAVYQSVPVYLKNVRGIGSMINAPMPTKYKARYNSPGSSQLFSVFGASNPDMFSSAEIKRILLQEQRAINSVDIMF